VNWPLSHYAFKLPYTTVQLLDVLDSFSSVEALEEIVAKLGHPIEVISFGCASRFDWKAARSD
jgi:hypothetical protein